MRIVVLAGVFGLGYVLGSRAGRERYAQIMAVTRKASQRLDERGLGGGLGSASRSPPIRQLDWIRLRLS